jgi:hypothetical protein
MRHECMVLRDEHGASLNSLATTMSEVPSARRSAQLDGGVEGMDTARPIAAPSPCLTMEGTVL